MHLEALGQAALRGLRPGRPLRDPARLLRVAVGMIGAAIGSYFLHVGAFLGGTEVSRRSVAALITDIITSAGTWSRANLGVDKPGTDGDRPAFM